MRARFCLTFKTLPRGRMAIECECEPEHSVTKLGHCRDCPGWSSRQVTMIERGLNDPYSGCPPKHKDGTAHDFNWATEDSATVSTGVCRCGLREIDQAMMMY